MQTLTPPNAIAPVQNTGSGDVEIGVAVVGWPPFDFNPLSVVILRKAIDTGLRRGSIAFTVGGGYFTPVCAVNIIKVRRDIHGAALESIKQTLGELGLLDNAKIARLDADSGFTEVFLAPSLIKLANSEMSILHAPRPTAEEFFKSLLSRYQQAQDRADNVDNGPENPS